MPTFWDTVRGHELASVLINYLPELTNKPRQMVVEIDQKNACSVIEDWFERGYCLHSMTSIQNEKLLCVFEK